MSLRTSCINSAVFLACVLCASSVVAERRFDVIAVDTIPALPDIRVLTIRDATMNVCYTAFVSEPGTHVDEDRRVESPLLSRAGAALDQRLTELGETFDKSAWNQVPGLPGPSALRYQWEAEKAQNEYMLAMLDHTIARAVDRLERVTNTPHVEFVTGGSCPSK